MILHISQYYYSTIFKTFQSDLDSLSNKIGFSKRNFAEWGKQVYTSFKESEGAVNKFKNVMRTAFVVPIEKNSWIKNSVGEIINEKNIDSLIAKFDTNSAREELQILQSIQSKINETKGSWDDYNNQFNDGRKYLLDYAKQNNVLESSVDDLKKVNEAARASAVAHNAALKSTTLSAKAGAVALQALATVGNMFAMWVISKVISGVIKRIDDLAHSAEKCKDRVDDLMSSYKSALDTANDNAKTIEELASKYEELSKGVNDLGENVALTADEYSEYNELVNQIADMFPTLIQGYTDEGNAILSLKGNVEELRDAYKEAQQEAYNMLIVSGKDNDGNDIIKNYHNQVNGKEPALSKYSSYINGRAGANDAIDIITRLTGTLTPDEFRETYDQLYKEYKNVWHSGKIQDALKSSGFKDLVGGLKWSKITSEDLAKVKHSAQETIKAYKDEIDSSLQDVQTLANAYLMTNEDYGKLSDQAKTAVSLLVNSIDENIANQFSSKVDVDDYVTGIVNKVKGSTKLRNSLTELFTLDTKNLTDTNTEKINSYIDAIAKAIGEDPIELKIRLGFDESDKEVYDNVLRKAKDALGGYAYNERGGVALTKTGRAIMDFWDENVITAEDVALWGNVTVGIKDATDAMNAYTKAKKEAMAAGGIADSLSITKTVEQLNTQLKPAMDSLKSAWQSIFTIDEDTGKQLFSLKDVGVETFESIRSDLAELDKIAGITIDYSSYEKFVSVLSNTSSTADDVQAQFDNLATSIVYATDCTDMSAETYDLLVKSLTEMGLTNAGEVLSNLGDIQAELASTGYDVANITAQEANELINLGKVSVETSEYLRLYLIQKELVQNPLDTSNDITALEKLCNSLGATAEMMELVESLKWALSVEEMGANLDSYKENIKNKIKDLINGEFDFKFKFSAPKSDNSKNKNKDKDTTKEFDWIEQAVENAEKEIKKLDDIVNSSYSTFMQKNDALAGEVGKVTEEIALQQKAYEEYMRKANSVGLDESYKALVRDGAIKIENISDEKLQEKISDYQQWYEKAVSASDSMLELGEKAKDLHVKGYELTAEQIEELLESESITEKQYIEEMGKLLKDKFGDPAESAKKLEAAKQNLEDEYGKLVEWGLGEYLEQVKNGTIQSVFGNVDMDKRTIITWSDELKQTYADALASWDYDPEIGNIDTVFGSSGRFGENIDGIGWEVAFTPILPDGRFLSSNTVYKYIEDIIAEAYTKNGEVTETGLKEIDEQGRQIGDTFVHGVFAGIDNSLDYANNGNWAETVGRLMHFSGDLGAVGLAKQSKKYYEDQVKYAEKAHEAKLNLLEKEKSYLNSVANAAASLFDKEIDKIQDAAEKQAKPYEDQIKGIESQIKAYNKQIDILNDRKKPLQDELDMLEEKARKENLILNLQKAQYEQERLENQRTNLIYTEEKGFVYGIDDAAARDARKNVDDAKLEIQKQSLQDRINGIDDEIEKYNEQIDALNDYIDGLNDLIDQINETAAAQVKSLEEMKNKWQEVIDQQEEAKKGILLTGEFGADAIGRILSGDESLLSQWKNSYLTTIAGIDIENAGYIGNMTERLATLYGVDLSPLMEQFYGVKGSVSDAAGSIKEMSKAISDGGNADVKSGGDKAKKDGISLKSAILDETETALSSFGQHSDSLNNGVIPAIQSATDSMNVFNRAAGTDIKKTVTIEYVTKGGGGGVNGKAFAGGSPKGLPRDEKNALRSEYGQQELTVYPDGTTELTTTPVMGDLPKGTVIYDEEQTKKILKNKSAMKGKAYAGGTVSEGWIGADGHRYVPIRPGDMAWEMKKAFEPLLQKMIDNPNYFAVNAMIEHGKQMEKVVNQLNTASVVTNNKQQQSIVNNNEFNITLPNVTNSTSAETLMRDLQSLATKKFQVNW